MKKTKRWLLIFAALIGLMAHAGALRATSLFGKGSTTTTSTTTTTTSTEAPVIEEETQTPDADNNTSSGPTLTGIPQIDYIWDPNLPRELNGYNLSEYPFYSTVPPEKEIGFKCDGLHDGFYASIKHKCQVYHHCIYGIRHDFLCANFTAFDQKTFICHFVSNVDCKNSAKYWHRNDALYMATTTTSTTTTTTPAPATQAPARRPGRPRRPLRRRRPSDYYYDEDYDDDYYEERLNRRRKQRPRTRYPEYDDDYEDRRPYSDDDRYEKRPMARDRHRDNDDDDDDMEENDRRISEKPRNRNRSSSAGGRFTDNDRTTERRKLPAEKKRLSIVDRRPTSEERRSFIDDRDRPQTLSNDNDDTDTNDRRPLKGRRRKNGDKRPTEYERPRHRDRNEDDLDSENSRRDEPQDSRVLVKPSAPATSSLGSLFDRPRAPPKIPRPVPINEKRKFDYSSKAVAAAITTTTSQPLETEEYYDEAEYDDPVPVKDVRESSTRKSQNESRKPLRDRDDETPRRNVEDEPLPKEHNSNSRRSQNDNQRKNLNRDEQNNRRETVSRPHRFQDESSSPRKSFHEHLRKQNAESQKPNDESIKSNSKVEDRPERGPYRMRPISSIISRDDAKSKIKPENDPVDNEDNDYLDRTRDYRHRTQENSRKTNNRYKEEPINHDRVENQKKSQQSNTREEDTDDDDDRESDTNSNSGERIHLPVELENKSEELYPDENLPTNSDKDNEPIREARPIVRIVKRPFLPSRGGSPYLPRGLQAVGAAQKQSTTTDSTPIDMGSTISGVRLLEHGAPILRGDNNNNYNEQQHNGPRTTQKPQIEYPKAILDELYENEYDVTLNDALNPTLKPLTSSRIFPSGFTSTNKFDRNRYQQTANSHNSDSYYSSTDVHRRAVQLPQLNNRQTTTNNRGTAAVAALRLAQHFYDEYEY